MSAVARTDLTMWVLPSEQQTMGPCSRSLTFDRNFVRLSDIPTRILIVYCASAR